MRVAIINGAPGSGKDALVTMCKDILGAVRVLNISTVDFVKEVATFCGWDGTKTPENRKFLSDLKKLLTEWDDVPMKKIKEEIKLWEQVWTDSNCLDKAVVFIHCREPEQIRRLVEEFESYEPVTLILRRTEVELQDQSNNSDKLVYYYPYDYTIYNEKNLSWLYNEARVFLQDYLKLDI